MIVHMIVAAEPFSQHVDHCLPYPVRIGLDLCQSFAFFFMADSIRVDPGLSIAPD